MTKAELGEDEFLMSMVKSDEQLNAAKVSFFLPPSIVVIVERISWVPPTYYPSEKHGILFSRRSESDRRWG